MTLSAPGNTRRRLLRWAASAPLAALLAIAADIPAADLPQITLSINDHRLTVEVAHTEPARAQGLMYRRMLPESRGMLFVFTETAFHGMWMMNTYVPLSVAFLDEQGIIINIADMNPHTRVTHAAARPAKYALEVNQGWFAKRGIKAGMRIQGIENAPPGR